MTDIPMLGGATEGVWLANKRDVLAVVIRLNSCIKHGGVHHFAVTGEGHTVYMSTAGLDCVYDILDNVNELHSVSKGE